MPAFIHFSDGRGWTIATVLADDRLSEGKLTTFTLRGQVVAKLSPDELWIQREPADFRRDGFDLHYWIETPRPQDHSLGDFGLVG